MSRPGRNARKARAKMKREVMPTFAVAFTRRQAAKLGLPVRPLRRPKHRHDGRPTGPERKHPDGRRKAA